jgi:cytochrome P450
MALFQTLLNNLLGIAQLWVLMLVAILVAVAYLAFKYPDRAVGTRFHPKFKSSTGLPIIGDLLDFAKYKDCRLERLEERHEVEGNYFRSTVPSLNGGSWALYVVIDPKDLEAVYKDPWTWIKGASNANLIDLLGFGIFAADGDSWFAQRKTSAHVFNVKNFRDVFSGDFNQEVQHAMEHLKAAADQKAFIDFQDLFLRMTLDSFGRIAMGSDFGCIKQKGHVIKGKYTLPDVAFMTAFDYVQNQCATRLDRPFWKFTDKVTGVEKRIRAAQKIMYEFAERVIADKEEKFAKGDQDYQDMLSYFMNTKNFDGTTPSKRQLVDTSMNLIIAGRDTTAQTLTWTFYELFHHPDKLEKAREEVLRVLGDDGECTYEAMKAVSPFLHKTDAVSSSIVLQCFTKR